MAKKKGGDWDWWWGDAGYEFLNISEHRRNQREKDFQLPETKRQLPERKRQLPKTKRQLPEAKGGNKTIKSIMPAKEGRRYRIEREKPPPIY